jgi:hypothetical protein
MTARFRHLLDDIRALVPHHKKESKVCCCFSASVLFFTAVPLVFFALPFAPPAQALDDGQAEQRLKQQPATTYSLFIFLSFFPSLILFQPPTLSPAKLAGLL